MKTFHIRSQFVSGMHCRYLSTRNLTLPQLHRVLPKHLLPLLLRQELRLRKARNVRIHIPKPNSIRVVLHQRQQPQPLVLHHYTTPTVPNTNCAIGTPIPSVNPLTCFGNTGPALSYQKRCAYAFRAASATSGNPSKNRSEISGNAPAPCDMRQCKLGNFKMVWFAVRLDIARAVSK